MTNHFDLCHLISWRMYSGCVSRILSSSVAVAVFSYHPSLQEQQNFLILLFWTPPFTFIVTYSGVFHYFLLLVYNFQAFLLLTNHDWLVIDRCSSILLLDTHGPLWRPTTASTNNFGYWIGFLMNPTSLPTNINAIHPIVHSHILLLQFRVSHSVSA